MEPIRLLIADDHPMVRDGLQRLLERESDLLVVAGTSGVRETLDAVQQFQPDVLLLDLHLADGSGRNVLAGVRRQNQCVRTIVITGQLQEGGAEEMIELGASGFLLKSASARELIQAIRTVHAGEIWADHGTLSRLVTHLRSGAEAGAADSWIQRPKGRERRAAGTLLSAREQEILQAVGQGLNNAEIAHRLYISENTVKAHLSRIFQKLVVTDRTQAVVAGLQRGLITSPGAERSV